MSNIETILNFVNEISYYSSIKINKEYMKNLNQSKNIIKSNINEIKEINLYLKDFEEEGIDTNIYIKITMKDNLKKYRKICPLFLIIFKDMIRINEETLNENRKKNDYIFKLFSEEDIKIIDNFFESYKKNLVLNKEYKMMTKYFNFKKLNYLQIIHYMDSLKKEHWEHIFTYKHLKQDFKDIFSYKLNKK